MIYTLNYVSHPIERVNQVVFVFLQNSIPKGIYSHNLFPEWFIDVLTNSRSSDGNQSFDEKFEEVYNQIQALNINRRSDLFREFSDGIDVRSLCSDPAKPVVLSENYSVALHRALNKLFKDHFYGVSLNSNKTIQTKLNTSLKEHYISFKNENNTGRVCPFCGLHEYAILDGESKDDYDHWLYKAKYPLYAVNFSNLVPMCDKCNQSGVKGVADVLHNSTTGLRRRSFYPYDKNNGVSVKVTNFTSPGQLSPIEREKYPYGFFEVGVNANDNSESDQVETWKDVFKISTRYNSYLSQFHNDLKSEFHEDYLQSHPEITLDRDVNKLRQLLFQFKSRLGNPRRKTCVYINAAYIDFLCRQENTYLLYSFCNINLAA